MRRDPDEPARADQTAALEQAFILEYLAKRGHTLATLHTLTPAEAHELLKDASAYASGRLTEVESRAHYVHDLHGKP